MSVAGNGAFATNTIRKKNKQPSAVKLQKYFSFNFI
jgi:hypothetical protein